MVATLDTLEIAKRLKGAGFDDNQAEAMTGVLRDFREDDRADLATKSDIALLRADIEAIRSELTHSIGALRSSTDHSVEVLKSAMYHSVEALNTEIERSRTDYQTILQHEINRLDAKIDTRTAELKADIIRWVFGIVFAQGASILGVLRFFPGGHP